MRRIRRIIHSSFVLSLFLISTHIFSQPIITSVTTTPADCHGSANGSITFTITGGTKPYYYYIISSGETLSSPQTNDTLFTFQNVKAGIYLCIVEDKNSLNDFRNRTVGEPEAIRITSVNQTPITCSGFADGKLNINASGESGTYNFLLNPVGLSTITGSFDMIAPGSYRVIVSDATGCTSKDSTDIIVFNDPLPIIITNENSTDPTCNSLLNGMINISATGGTGGLEYTLNPGGIKNNDGNFHNLSQGNYTVSVTDINGCPGPVSSPLTLTEPMPLIFTSQTKTDISCNGFNDGSIIVSADGGTAPYVFTLIPGGISNSDGYFSNLAPGTYTISLNDFNSCGPVISNVFVISQPEVIIINSVTSKDISCHNLNDGEIHITASGGNAPLSYILNPSGISSSDGNFTGLSAGTYTVTVVDSKGCSPATSSPINIINPPLITITNQTIGHISCYGDRNGSINVSAQGGSGTLYYTLNPGSLTRTNGNFTGLGPGIYTVTVSDANNCPQASTGPLQITEAPEIVVSLASSSVLNLLCNGDSNGVININVSGGSAPYSFSWTGPNGFIASSQNISGLTAGNYNLSIQDSKSCTKTYTSFATITQAPAIQISFTTIEPLCHGSADGSVTIHASGGTPGYTYSINGLNYQTSNVFSALSGNNYTIYVKDNNSCIESTNVMLNEPAELKIASETVIDGNLCFGEANGEISINGVSGGSPPYEYSINGGLNFSSSSTFTNLAAGAYQTVVRDSKGCLLNGKLNIINQPPAIQINSLSLINVMGCYGNNNGQIEILASGGTGSLQYSINGGSPNSSGIFTNLKAGTYFIQIRDINNCTKDTTVSLTEPPEIRILSFSKSNVSGCSGDASGTVNVTAAGGSGSLQYRLNSNPFQPDGNFTGLRAGSYTLTIQDNNNCRKDTLFQITEPAPISADITSTVYINENYKGSITISNVTGGTGTYSYSINGMSGPFTSQTYYSGLNAGVYTVVVRDQNNCTFSRTIEITSMPPLNVSYTTKNPSCNGYANGTIRISVTNASGNISYSIDDSLSWHSNNEFLNLAAGAYKIVVKDETGRYFTSNILLQDPPPIVVSLDIKPASCNAFSPDGSVTVSANGGTGNKTFRWSDGSTSKDRLNINSGDYLLTTTDENGCQATTPVLIPATTYVFANAGKDTTVCEGSTISLQGQGGSSFLWSPSSGLSNPNIANPSATINHNSTYILTVTGANGCYNTDTVNINIYPKLGLSAGNDTTMIINNPVNLNATGGPFVSYLWTPSGGLSDPTIPNPVANPRTSQLYIVSAVDQNGCTEKDSIYINVIERIVIYSSFSPNDDGINDFWDIDHAEYYPDIIVEVFNRWGEKLFSSKGYTSEKRWDGYYKGKPVPIGTYYYVIIPYNGAKPITGPLTIIR